MMDVVLVLTTVSDVEQGRAIADALVTEHLAACVTLSGAVASTYRWEGVVEHATEYQLVVKTTRARLAAVESRVGELHTYDLPEFLVLPVLAGSAGYLRWVEQEVASVS